MVGELRGCLEVREVVGEKTAREESQDLTIWQFTLQ